MSSLVLSIAFKSLLVKANDTVQGKVSRLFYNEQINMQVITKENMCMYVVLHGIDKCKI